MATKLHCDGCGKVIVNFKSGDGNRHEPSQGGGLKFVLVGDRTTTRNRFDVTIALDLCDPCLEKAADTLDAAFPGHSFGRIIRADTSEALDAALASANPRAS